MNESILILDGISQIPVGNDIARALKAESILVTYIDLAALPKRPLYKFGRITTKYLHKHDDVLPFFYHPKVQPSAIKNVFEKAKPTVVMVIGFVYSFIDLSLLATLKQSMGFKLVLFDTDSANTLLDPRKFQYWLHKEISLYDKILSFSKRMSMYFKDFCDSTFFPYGASETSIRDMKKEEMALFVGVPDTRRLVIFEALKDLPISIVGKRWKHYRKLVSPELRAKIIQHNVWHGNLSELLQNSAIVLNVNNFAYYGIGSGMNLRVFEALAHRCFLITEYCDELSDIFEVGKELESFRSIDELREKIMYYLSHPSEREAIAERGYKKVQTQYLWPTRAKALIEHIRQV